MKKFKSVIIVGSSGSGKTTLVNGLRTINYEAALVIPRRFITRPQRLGDDLTENLHINKEDFQKRVTEKSVAPHWSRILDAGRQELYGFETVDKDDDRLRIYSANNAFLRDTNSSVTEILNDGLVVVAMAAADSRDSRLDKRSPDMSDAERNVRLSDAGVDVLATDFPVKIIDTTNLSPLEGQKALQDIVAELI